MKLQLSALARADLRAIASKVKHDNGTVVADRIVSRVTAGMKHLERFPEMGHLGREPDTRELGVAGLPFIIVYQLRPNVVAVMRVIHGAMQWPPVD